MTTRAEAIEAVAKAICRVQYNGADPEQPAIRWNGTDMEPQDFPAWRDFMDEANAAYEALALPPDPPCPDCHEMTTQRDHYRAECDRLRTQLGAANQRADAAEARLHRLRSKVYPNASILRDAEDAPK